MPQTQSTRKTFTGRASPTSQVFGDYFKEMNPTKRPISTTINKPLEFVYSIVSDVKNFPLFFENLEKIEEIGSDQSKWHFKNNFDQAKSMVIPMKVALQKNGEALVYTSKDDSGVQYKIAVQLQAAPAGRGTVARMMIAYESKSDGLVGFFENLFGTDVELLAKKNLQRLKVFCETGHVPTTEGQSSGRDEDQPENTKH